MSYQLKHVYKELLTEALINKSTFLEKLVDIANERPETEGQYGNIIRLIVDKYKETNLAKLTGKVNNKKRKKAELSIHKALKSIKGLDGTPIDFNRLLLFYDSIIDHLNEHVDVSIDDCLLAADYYMKDFYETTNWREKLSIEKGEYVFDYVLYRTSFYQEFLDFKENISSVKQKVIRIYEDDKIKIIMPTSSGAFNYCISEEEVNLSWCTQNATTWHNYTKKQFVMLLRNKLSFNEDNADYIISLKISHDGRVMWNETCDRNNNHMSKESLSPLITSKVEKEIARMVNLDSVQEELQKLLVTNTDYEITDYLTMLLEQNRFDDIVSLLCIITYNAADFDAIDSDLNKLYFEAIETNKKVNFTSILAEFLSTMNFNEAGGINLLLGASWKIFLSRNGGLKDDITNYLLEKSLNKRSHVKYFLLLMKLIDTNNHPDTLRNLIAELKKAAINALNTNLVHTFKRIITDISNNPIANDAILLYNDFVEIFETKGFVQYLIQKKGNVIRQIKSTPYNHLDAEDIISEIIKYNRDYFLESFHNFKTDAQSKLADAEANLADAEANLADAEANLADTESKLTNSVKLDSNSDDTKKLRVALERQKKTSKKCINKLKNVTEQHDIAKQLIVDFEIKDVDINLLIKVIIENKDKSLSKINIENLTSYFFELDKTTAKKIIDNFLYDLETFKYLASKNSNIISAGYRYFLNYYYYDVMDYNNDAYEVFSYILSKSKTFTDTKLNDPKTLIIYATLSVLFKKTIDISEPIKKEMIKLIEHKGFIDLIFSQNYIRYFTSTPDFYINLINESNSASLLESIKQKISASVLEGLLSKEKVNIVNRLSSIPKIQKLLTKDLDQNKLTDIFQVYVLLYINKQIDVLTDDQIFKLTTSHINSIIKGDAGKYLNTPESLYYSRLNTYINAVNTFAVNSIAIDSDLSLLVSDNVDRKYILNTNYTAFKDLAFKLIKKYNDNSAEFDKRSLAEIIYSNRFKDLHDSPKSFILENFIVVNTDNKVGYEKYQALNIIKSCLVNGMIKSKRLVKDSELILSYIRKLSKPSQKKMQAAFPAESDLNEMMLKEYLRLLFN